MEHARLLAVAGTDHTVVASDGERVLARSEFLGVQRDGSVGSGVYNDELRRTPDGWRIASRSVALRREPLVPDE